MKRCPQCNRVEADTALIYCRADGALLIKESATTDGEAQTRTLQGKNGTIGPTAGPTTRLIEDRKESQKRISRSTKVGLTLGAVILVVIAAAAYLYTTRKLVKGKWVKRVRKKKVAPETP